MNAHAPMTQAIIDNEPLLRAIEAGGVTDHLALAKALGRRSDNVARTLQGMIDAGLAQPTDFAWILTDTGRRALAALDVAAGRAEVSGAADDVVALRHDQIIADPDNARTASGLDEESLADLADTLARETMLQPPMVRRVDPAVALYQLVYGERRWRAWGLLIAQGRWPADKTIPCKLATGDKAQADIVALIENLQRTDIDNLEAGESFVRVAKAHNMSPQTIAARIGKDPRFVQIAMQVAAEATPEDKAAYRASQAAYAADKTRRTFTWTKLRESVREHEDRPPLALDPKAAAALGEIFLVGRRHTPEGELLFAPMARDIVDAPLVELTSRGLARFAFRDGVKGLEPIVTTEVNDWIGFHGLTDDPPAAVERLQAAVVGEMMAAKLRADGLFVTLAFNQPEAAPALHQPSPRPSASAEPGPRPSATLSEADEIASLRGVDAIADADPPPIDEPPPHDSVEPQPNPAREPGDDFSRQIRAANAEAAAEARIPPMQRLILIELRHALLNATDVQETMTGDRGLDFGGEFWTDTAAQALIAAGLIATLQAHDGRHMVLLTDPGDKAVNALGIGSTPTPADLDKARRDAHWPREDGAPYSIAWLNPPPPAAPAANPVRAPFPMPFQLILIRTEADQIARANQEPHDVTEIGMRGTEDHAHDFAEDLIANGIAVEVEIRSADGDLLFHFDNSGAA